MRETCTRLQCSHIKSLCQRLPQIGKCCTRFQIDSWADWPSISEEWYIFASMICATIGRVHTMICRKEEGISWLHKALHLGHPAINVTQCLRITVTVATMSPEHIKFYQIHKKQSCKVSLHPAQCSCHALSIGFRVVALCQSTTGKKIFYLTYPDHFLASCFEQIQQG